MSSSIIYIVHWPKLKFVAYSVYLYTPAEKFMSINGGLRYLRVLLKLFVTNFQSMQPYKLLHGSYTYLNKIRNLQNF